MQAHEPGAPDASGPSSHEQADDFTSLPAVRTRSVAIALAIAVCAFAGLFLLGWAPRRARLAEVAENAPKLDDRIPVDTVNPRLSSQAADLRLPADVRSMQQTSIYTRANGYLKRILVDIGDHVEAGALLAEIDTPDVDADFARATANVALAQANLAKAQDDFTLTDATFKRYVGAVEAGSVTQQQLDEKRSALAQAKLALEAGRASVAVAEAEAKRLSVTQGFERMVAPFAGTITARNYDVGALLAPTNSGEGRELYRIERADVLRAFVSVPQAQATAVTLGGAAFLTVRNYADREFVGKIVRSAGALEPSTRTLRFEVDVPNADGALFSGMYGEVRLPLTAGQASLLVPTSALVFGADGSSVWVVESERAHRKKVSVGRDFGTEIEVTKGLTEQDTVVKNPGERLVEGGPVHEAGKAQVPAAPAR